VRIGRRLLDQIIEHARRDAPNECCGVVASQDGDARAVFELENLAASPLRFEVGADLVGVMDEIDGAGHDLGAIYHSHTRTAPYPSQTDVNFSVNWPGVEWIIVGLANGADAEVRSYRIEGGRIEEVALEVT
jgi:[CysO sulfur-carrier protein]-S-L-cysteine hydrolase